MTNEANDTGDASGPGSCAGASSPSVSPLRAAIPIALPQMTGKPTTDDRARQAYRTIEAFGWDIHWRGKKPVPDDAWPIDIIRRAINAELIAFANDLNTLKWMGDAGWETALLAVRKHLYELAQGIVTQRDETRSGSVEQSEIEPGPKDAP